MNTTMSELHLHKFYTKIIPLKNGCWKWIGQKEKGYPRFLMHGTYYRAHRLSYSHFKGEFEDSLEMDHLCENPLCVNPDHLEPVTGEENRRRYKASKKAQYVANSFRKSNKYCKVGHPIYGPKCILCKELVEGNKPLPNPSNSKFITQMKRRQRKIKKILKFLLAFRQTLHLDYVDKLDFSQLLDLPPSDSTQ